MEIVKADVIISGWNGKMGQALRALLPRYFSGQVVDANELGSCSLSLSKVWIDFSHVSAFEKWIAKVAQLQCPFVMGTTGLNDRQFQQLGDLSQNQPILYDANFSEGIQVLRQILKGLPDVSTFDCQILEAHHRSKKDCPSGTAKVLMKDLSEKTQKIVPISSIRSGGIRGEHTIILAGINEQITLKHEVWDRSVFAEGALKAAQWLLQQSHGFFSFNSVLQS